MRVCVCYLGRQQGVGVEALHVGDQIILRVYHIFHESAVEKEPVGPAVHRDAFWDFTITKPPHVGVALIEQAVQTLLTDKPKTHTHTEHSKIQTPWTVHIVLH